MRRALTLFELIFVVVVLGLMFSIFTVKTLSSSKRTGFFSTLNSDVSSLIETVNEWKSNSPLYKGSFLNLKNASYLKDYLPPNMKIEEDNGIYYVDSSGFGKDVKYAIEGNSPNSVEIDVYYKDEIENPNTRKKYAKEIVNVFKRISQDKDSVTYDLSESKEGIVKVKNVIP